MYNALIELSSNAYTPEAYAYADYLKKRGINVNLTSSPEHRSDYDIGIKFLGLHPYWKKNIYGRCRIEIHEYHSLSTPPLPKFKDLIKSVINSRPDRRIFLNNEVKKRLKFITQTPYIFRGMGVDKEFYNTEHQNKEYHLLYSGSTNGRPGLLEEILRLSKIGFKILIIGNPSKDLVESVRSHKNVTLTGKINREYLPTLYKQCLAGINFTPNLYPFNIQESTKTLEYCASGIGVVSNKYEWVTNFCNDRIATFLWLENLSTVNQLENFNFTIPKLFDLEWETLLDSINFYDFCLNGSM